MGGRTRAHVVIDLGPEVVVDRSRIRDPYVRLLLAAVGEPLAAGSPWVAVDKRAAFPRSVTTVHVRPERPRQPGSPRSTRPGRRRSPSTGSIL
jgi:hypothetical protein